MNCQGLPSLPSTITRETKSNPILSISTTPEISEVSGDSLLRQTLSNRAARTTPTNNDSQIIHNGSTYQRITNHVNICYHIQSLSRQTAFGALIDGGANGGMSGSDVRVI